MPEVNSDCPPSVGVAVLDGSSLLSVALGGSSSIGMCRHARCRSCGDDRSQQRLSVMLYGSSLHWWVSPFLFGHPCRCQKSTATVLHWWVSLFLSGHPCCLLCSMGHPCIDGCRHARWVIPAVCCSRWIILAEVNSCCFPLMGVAMFGVDLAEMTGANSGCLLCPVDYPCIGRCRHVWWVIPADARSQ